jgi:precorrin-6A/cobalt-precorrin-6A reductase
MPDTRRRALVLGGTAETAKLAQGLAAQGFDVVVSTFSDAALELGDSPRITRRVGPLDVCALTECIAAQKIVLAVDALHPYASVGHQTCSAVARLNSCRWLRLSRPSSTLPDFAHACATHAQAAAQMVLYNKPVLLTIGSRFLFPYAQAARAAGLPLLARVLDDAASLQVCADLGLVESEVIAARGPFSVEQNLEHMDRVGAGVLVTKDGGATGGLPEKLAAAQLRGCQVLLVERPAEVHDIPSYTSVAALLKAV